MRVCICSWASLQEGDFRDRGLIRMHARPVGGGASEVPGERLAARDVKLVLIPRNAFPQLLHWVVGVGFLMNVDLQSPAENVVLWLYVDAAIGPG